MKVNKITMFACGIISILTIILTIIIGLKYDTSVQKISLIFNICLGLFTSSTISMVIAIVGYFHAKEVINEKVKFNLQSLYLNMIVHSRTLGQTVPQIHTATYLEQLPFKNISSISQLSLEFINNMEVGLFCPIFENSKLSKVYSQLAEFQIVLYNIKNISMQLETMILEYSNKALQLQVNQQNGIKPNPNDLQSLDQLKNIINIKTAKLHEHATDRSMQLEKIAQQFYSCNHDKTSWETIKSDLMVQARNIVG